MNCTQKVVTITETIATRGTIGFADLDGNGRKWGVIVDHVFEDGRLLVTSSSRWNESTDITFHEDFEVSREAYGSAGGCDEPQWDGDSCRCTNFWSEGNEPNVNQAANTRTDEQAWRRANNTYSLKSGMYGFVILDDAKTCAIVESVTRATTQTTAGMSTQTNIKFAAFTRNKDGKRCAVLKEAPEHAFIPSREAFSEGCFSSEIRGIEGLPVWEGDSARCIGFISPKFVPNTNRRQLTFDLCINDHERGGVDDPYSRLSGEFTFTPYS